jgi:L-ascorbate metabolism protein UlaG (beta-lactamase superfamily)
MEIIYLGHASFKLKGKSKTVVCDPYGDQVGKFPRDVEADIVTVSHGHFDHNATEKIKATPAGGQGTPFIINSPGEYEIGGVSVIGIPTFHDDKQGVERGQNTVYVIEMDGLRIAHLGDLGHKFSDAQLEEMGPIDILLIPVGGFYTIDAKAAKEIVGQVDPWVVIPMHYSQPGTTVDKIAGVEPFLQEMGKTGTLPIPKYPVTVDKLPEDLQVVVLEKKA